MPNLHELEMKWGAPAAYQFLTEVERAAGISALEIVDIDLEARLTNAIRRQDAMRTCGDAA